LPPNVATTVKLNLRALSCKALLAAAQRAAPEIEFDERGYTIGSWRQNMLPTAPEILCAIEADYRAAAGHELGQKLRAAHSSAALVINTFAPWRLHPASLILPGTGFHSLRFEKPCPTGLSGTPPHLDLVADGDLPTAVESKCTEWLTARGAKFAESYLALRTDQGGEPWVAAMLRLRRTPDSYRYLDAAQLIKHAFGLLRCFPGPVVLLYLYWEPRNSSAWPECAAHRAEMDRLGGEVRRSRVRLEHMSYRELWSSWEQKAPKEHLARLRLRYDVEVGTATLGAV
jgi:hypothetical protein